MAIEFPILGSVVGVHGTFEPEQAGQATSQVLHATEDGFAGGEAAGADSCHRDKATQLRAWAVAAPANATAERQKFLSNISRASSLFTREGTRAARGDQGRGAALARDGRER